MNSDEIIKRFAEDNAGRIAYAREFSNPNREEEEQDLHLVDDIRAGKILGEFPPERQHTQVVAVEQFPTPSVPHTIVRGLGEAAALPLRAIRNYLITPKI